jgi:hypothetical protein
MSKEYRWDAVEDVRGILDSGTGIRQRVAMTVPAGSQPATQGRAKFATSDAVQHLASGKVTSLDRS